MAPIIASELPNESMLQRYQRDGSYTDCYYMDLPRHISMTEYIASFYTTSLFKVERGLLALVARKPTSDEDALRLGQGHASDFSIWRVEDRASNQLLLRDTLWRTRSWLMVEPHASFTRLYFGSAVMPQSRAGNGKTSFGLAFYALHTFHHLYTKALMRAAQTKLDK